MKVKATKLRQNIYTILDEVLETGRPVEIERKGKTLKIVPTEKVDRLKRLTSHDCMNEDPESYVHNDWSEEWSGEL